MKMTVKVEGLDEIKKNLDQLKYSTGRSVQRRVLMKHGVEMADGMKAIAPIDTGTLKDSIKATTKRPRGMKSAATRAYAKAMRMTKDKALARAAAKDAGRSLMEVFIGPNTKAFYSHFVEFGTVTQSPQPFMRPVWDGKKGRLIPDITRDLRAEIDKALKRAARKAAREAKKAK